MTTPDHLATPGATLYGDVTAVYDLTLTEQAMLLQAAETLDLLVQLREAVADTGPIVNDAPSKLLAEIRQQRVVLARLLGAIALTLDGDDDPTSSATVSLKAGRAARARWGKVH